MAAPISASPTHATMRSARRPLADEAERLGIRNQAGDAVGLVSAELGRDRFPRGEGEGGSGAFTRSTPTLGIETARRAPAMVPQWGAERGRWARRPCRYRGPRPKSSKRVACEPAATELCYCRRTASDCRPRWFARWSRAPSCRQMEIVAVLDWSSAPCARMAAVILAAGCPRAPRLTGVKPHAAGQARRRSGRDCRGCRQSRQRAWARARLRYGHVGRSPRI